MNPAPARACSENAFATELCQGTCDEGICYASGDALPTVDTEIWLYDSEGTQLANNDDIGYPNRYSQIEGTLSTPGTYYIKVAHYSGNGPHGQLHS